MILALAMGHTVERPVMGMGGGTIKPMERLPAAVWFSLSERQVRLPNGFDNTFYPPGMENVPRRFAIVHANRYMIDHSDHLICYVWHAASNARNLLEHAERRAETKIHNIYKNVNPNSFLIPPNYHEDHKYKTDQERTT